MQALRVAAVAVSFAIFGLGGLLFGFVVTPLLRAVARKANAQRTCRLIIHFGFRAFLRWLSFLGLLRCEIEGASRLQNVAGTLVVANHPSLIDVVVLVSHLPNAYCVVKEGVWLNPFYGHMVRAAGYIPSINADYVVERSAALIRAGETVVLFPEGTRTPPGTQPVVRRGAALVLLRANRPALPVRLHLSPPALAKGHRLHRFPSEQLRFSVAVGDMVNPESFARGRSERANAQAGARMIERVLRADPPSDEP